MAKRLGSSYSMDWEIVEVTQKTKGTKKSRPLKVKSASSTQEEDNPKSEVARTAAMDSSTSKDTQKVNGTLTQQLATYMYVNEPTQLRRLSTTHHVSLVSILQCVRTYNCEHIHLFMYWAPINSLLVKGRQTAVRLLLLLTLVMEEVKCVQHSLKDHGVEDLECPTAGQLEKT